MSLRFNVGDRVRVAQCHNPVYRGMVTTITHVGPWQRGDDHPNGLRCLTQNDYLVADTVNTANHWGLACRDENLEAA